MAEKVETIEEFAKAMEPVMNKLEAAIPRLAKLKHMYYEALIKAGFNPPNALQLVCSMSVSVNL